MSLSLTASINVPVGSVADQADSGHDDDSNSKYMKRLIPDFDRTGFGQTPIPQTIARVPVTRRRQNNLEVSKHRFIET